MANFILVQCQFMELSHLLFAAMKLDTKFLQVWFRSLHPSTKSQLQVFNNT